MRGQLNSALRRIDDPTYNRFPGGPDGVAFEELFERCGFLPMDLGTGAEARGLGNELVLI